VSVDAHADLTPTVTAFAEHARWSGVLSSDREAWLAARRKLLTASESSSIMGENPYSDALSVFVDKTAGRISAPEPGPESPIWWGNLLEQPILSGIAKYNGWSYRPGGALLISRHFDFLGATLDAEIDRDDGVGPIIFEGKTTTITKDWDENAQTLPMHVLIQVQHQLMVSGAPKALVFALLQGSRPCQIEVFPSPDFQAILISRAQEFMDRVARLDAPSPTHMSAPSLERMFPLSDGSIVKLPDLAIDWTAELAKIAGDVKDLLKRKEELRNMIRKAIGNATFGELSEPVNGKQYWRWLESRREGYTVEPRDEWSLLSLKGATMPGEKAGVQSVRISETAGSDDLEDGQQVVRLKKRRR